MERNRQLVRNVTWLLARSILSLAVSFGAIWWVVRTVLGAPLDVALVTVGSAVLICTVAAVRGCRRSYDAYLRQMGAADSRRIMRAALKMALAGLTAAVPPLAVIYFVAEGQPSVAGWASALGLSVAVIALNSIKRELSAAETSSPGRAANGHRPFHIPTVVLLLPLAYTVSMALIAVAVSPEFGLAAAYAGLAAAYSCWYLERRRSARRVRLASLKA